MRFSFVKAIDAPIHITAKMPSEAREKLRKLLAKPEEINQYRILAVANDDQKAPPVKADDIPEFVGQIIDIFEDFLDERGIILDNPERDEDENLDPEESCNIFGSDYSEIQEHLEQMLTNWSVIEPRS